MKTLMDRMTNIELLEILKYRLDIREIRNLCRKIEDLAPYAEANEDDLEEADKYI